ncbi:C40 family peptidase [Qaidamihabitans albus]|uniref:C40 family peptidase n=1 Tax=Qaidamihabitans albus TaxID=2795733 RepID=UPI0035590333
MSASDTTDAEGVAAIPATVDRDAQWRLRFAGDQVHDPARSRVQTIDSREPIGQRIVDTAAAQAGKPYSYGADGPGSFDCSGLTQYVHRQVGIELPRTSSDQRAAVPTIAKSDMRPGDLVFFDDGGVYHVGIFAGDDRIWAAPEPGDSVRLQDIWTETYTVGRAW